MSLVDTMAALFASGHAVDIVLIVMIVEAVWLATRDKWAVADIAACILPGALMMLALRAALTGAGWPWVALFLTLSLPVHLADLRRRRSTRPT